MIRLSSLQERKENLLREQEPKRQRLLREYLDKVEPLNAEIRALEIQIQEIQEEKALTVGRRKKGTSAIPSESCDWSFTRHLLASPRDWISEVAWVRIEKDHAIARHRIQPRTSKNEEFHARDLELARKLVDQELRKVGFLLLETAEDVTAKLEQW